MLRSESRADMSVNYTARGHVAAIGNFVPKHQETVMALCVCVCMCVWGGAVDRTVDGNREAERGQQRATKFGIRTSCSTHWAIQCPSRVFFFFGSHPEWQLNSLVVLNISIHLLLLRQSRSSVVVVFIIPLVLNKERHSTLSALSLCLSQCVCVRAVYCILHVTLP